MLGYISLFIRILEKCAAYMEEVLQACSDSGNKNINKDIEKLFSCSQIQIKTILSVEELETIY